jgi:hypothetical protein
MGLGLQKPALHPSTVLVTYLSWARLQLATSAVLIDSKVAQQV